MLKVEHISKDYGRYKPIQDISFSMNRGEVLGLLGANGTGKSTTLNMIAGYFPPSSGRITLEPHDLLTSPLLYKQNIGYLPEFPPLYPDMTVEEQLTFICSVKGVDRKKRTSEIDRVCGLTHIMDMKKRPIRAMSKGYKQRIGMAQALVGGPKLLILDEPTSGLDPQQIIDIRELVKDLGREHGIIISSHILSEIASVATRILVLNKGYIVADSPVGDLMNPSSGSSVLEVRILGDVKKAQSYLESIEGVRTLRLNDCSEEGCWDFEVTQKDGYDIRRELSIGLSSISCSIMQLKMKNPTLEEIFIDLTASSTSGRESDT
ncbi:ABC transporter ATP-binding protein [Oceanispirochaeta crateris]|uniref:ABC transporter ATP-binding protein n=1 Tax=Oceanispirochaeta crateris TaxID=2518645 RepID=A0A5C1QPM3_9SPIO|nr:ABC transporter ATP-binding protein [Oceanispirochaeta crateris]QEN09591.1 ABC transporter ATP-binding protein [Oceanispirochaeta crateris]